MPPSDPKPKGEGDLVRSRQGESDADAGEWSALRIALWSFLALIGAVSVIGVLYVTYRLTYRLLFTADDKDGAPQRVEDSAKYEAMRRRSDSRSATPMQHHGASGSVAQGGRNDASQQYRQQQRDEAFDYLEQQLRLLDRRIRSMENRLDRELGAHREDSADYSGRGSADYDRGGRYSALPSPVEPNRHQAGSFGGRNYSSDRSPAYSQHAPLHAPEHEEVRMERFNSSLLADYQSFAMQTEDNLVQRFLDKWKPRLCIRRKQSKLAVETALEEISNADAEKAEYWACNYPGYPERFAVVPARRMAVKLPSLAADSGRGARQTFGGMFEIARGEKFEISRPAYAESDNG